MTSSYHRVILKLSGEALGVDGKLFCHEKFEKVAEMLIAIQKTGVQLAVVIGGGNVWRGRRGAATRMGTVAADQMGMLGTLQNCLYMRDTLANLGAKAHVMSGVDIPRFAQSYHTVSAIEALESGTILLLACGLGNPCFSTDSAVVLRAIELNCDAILMAKNIDGAYTADPNLDASATLIKEITYAQAAERNLKVMDAAAFIMLRENEVPVVRIFGLEPPENVLKVLAGDPMGTLLHP
ncbi:MAG: uridine monophosphate kinase [Clostridia bacterium]